MKEHTDYKSQDQDIAKTNKIVCSWNFQLAEEVAASFLLLVVGSIYQGFYYKSGLTKDCLWMVYTYSIYLCIYMVLFYGLFSVN